MLTFGFCKACNRALSTGAKKLIPLTVLPSTARGLVNRVKGTHTSGEVVQRGKVFQVTAVAAEQDLAQVDQAVDRLLDRREFRVARAVTVFHLAVVLEEGHVVGVVSIRSTMPNLSYILIDALPK